MNLMQLKYVLEVEKAGSISQAAQNLYMNQPNLSKSIKELEESLGIHIFYRTHRGVTPTPKGQEFLVHARQVVQKADDLTRFCQQDYLETLSVISPHASYISTSFASTLKKQLRTSSSLSVKYSERYATEIADSILAGEHALGIVRCSRSDKRKNLEALNNAGLSYVPLLEFVPKLTFSHQNPLVLKDTISLSHLEVQTEIITDPKSHNFLFRSGEPRPRRFQATDRSNQYLLLQTLPETYLWASPMPDKFRQEQHLIQREVPEVTEQFLDLLVYLQGKRLSPIEESFIKEIQKTIRELTDK